jgi:hypothetical protein
MLIGNHRQRAPMVLPARGAKFGDVWSFAVLERRIFG